MNVLKRGTWTSEEDHRLLELVESMQPLKWVNVAAQMGTRTSKQCRERYHNYLKPSLSRTPITSEEGRKIEELVKKHGKKWAEISRHLPGRSDNAIKNWWNAGAQRRRTSAEINMIPQLITTGSVSPAAEPYNQGPTVSKPHPQQLFYTGSSAPPPILPEPSRGRQLSQGLIPIPSQGSQMSQYGSSSHRSSVAEGQMGQMGQMGQIGPVGPVGAMGQMNQMSQMGQMGQVGQIGQVGPQQLSPYASLSGPNVSAQGKPGASVPPVPPVPSQYVYQSPTHGSLSPQQYRHQSITSIGGNSMDSFASSNASSGNANASTNMMAGTSQQTQTQTQPQPSQSLFKPSYLEPPMSPMTQANNTHSQAAQPTSMTHPSGYNGASPVPQNPSFASGDAPQDANSLLLYNVPGSRHGSWSLNPIDQFRHRSKSIESLHTDLSQYSLNASLTPSPGSRRGSLNEYASVIPLSQQPSTGSTPKPASLQRVSIANLTEDM